mgnify:CR=1 FL=1
MTKRVAKKTGRPTVMTDRVLDLLRQAYLWGATNAEACAYAEISARSLYEYLEKNPEFSQKIEEWKTNPLLRAKKKVVEDIDKDVKNAQWYLERKQKDEFSTKVENDIRVKELPKPILGGETVVEVIEDKDV